MKRNKSLYIIVLVMCALLSALRSAASGDIITLQAENYLVGTNASSGVDSDYTVYSYYDTTAGNSPGSWYRHDDVDIANVGNTSPGTWGVGTPADGEWFYMSSDTGNPWNSNPTFAGGTYKMSIRYVAGGVDGTRICKLYLDGTNEFASFSFDNTGWFTPEVLVAATNTISAGEHTVKFYIDTAGSGFSLDWISFERESESENIPLSVHSLFSDNMVLQRDMPVPIWGYVTSGETVVVHLDGEIIGSAVADENGRWEAEMTPHSYDGGLSHVLLVSSEGELDIQFNEVVFGEVIIASGQSNMARFMSSGITGYEEELLVADSYPLIRQVSLEASSSTTEQEEPILTYAWRKCSSSSLPEFTATGYFFAKKVYLETGMPVGLLYSAWGGQKIERFINPEGMEAVPELSGMLQNQEQGGITNFYDIYNAMIVSMMPYGVRGAIWYQGEANAGNGDLYRSMMLALIRGWRQKWGQGDFPFYYVQLASFDGSLSSYWPILRQAQFKALSETNTGMVVAMDIGMADDIHPHNKYDTGCRLAQWTLAKDLGYDPLYSGPLHHSLVVNGSQIRVLFDYANGDLFIGQKDSTNSVQRVDGPLQNFEIAGADKNFVDAEAVIDGDTVLVSSPSVTSPVYVRYCYVAWPSGSNQLYNAAGLPASPFRTDEEYELVYISAGIRRTVWLETGEQSVVAASAPEAGKVFDRWVGAASELDNLNALTATVTMPGHGLYLLATYRDATASVYTLTVNGGFGSGTSQSGSILNIKAASIAGQVFDHWAGDTQTVVNVNAPSTTLRMPSNNVAVTTVYRIIDSVGDGIDDEWRAAYFGGDGSTTNSQSFADADPDGDGMTNEQEFRAGTSPVDVQSCLSLGGSFSNTDAAIQFPTVGGHSYLLEKSTTLAPFAWETVFFNITGDGNQKVLQLNLDNEKTGFYRLQLNDN